MPLLFGPNTSEPEFNGHVENLIQRFDQKLDLLKKKRVIFWRHLLFPAISKALYS